VNQRLRQRNNEDGFTLIELLIVIIILAILAAIVVFAVGTTTANATAASCQTDAKTYETAVQAFDAALGRFPVAGLGTELTETETAPGGGTVGPFLRQLPSTTHYVIATDGSGNVYVYPPTPPDPIAVSDIYKDYLNMPTRTVGGLLGTTDTTLLNFDVNNGAICTDPSIAT
jgi:prepilin-type N-terminal cleavage/methylation domain-containing protein